MRREFSEGNPTIKLYALFSFMNREMNTFTSYMAFDDDN